MRHKIYIASTLDNWQRVRRLRDRLATLGVDLTYDWTTHNNGQQYIEDSNPKLKREIGETELHGIFHAEAVLVVMPGGNGTHFEFACAFLWEKPIVLLLDEHTGKSPAFHFLDTIFRSHNEDEAIDKLMKYLRCEESVLRRSYLITTMTHELRQEWDNAKRDNDQT